MSYYYWVCKTNGEYKIASVPCVVLGQEGHRGFHLLRDVQFSGRTELGGRLYLELYEVKQSIGNRNESKWKVLDMLNGKIPEAYNLRKFGEIKFTVPTDFNNIENNNIEIRDVHSDTHSIYYVKSEKWELEIVKMFEGQDVYWTYCLPKYFE